MHELISCFAMRRLPSLDSLRVFEAAARHLSLTKASDELHVTQSALSHRIQALEAELGITLFRRYARRIELTPAGEILAAGVRRGLGEIMRALASIDPAGATTSLTISVLPSFATRWLIPRLGRFRSEHPEIDVRIAADPALVDFHKGNADLGIRFGRGRYPGLHTQLLMADAVFPVCSPDFRRRMGDLARPDDLLRCTLLHDEAAESDGSGADWVSWFRHVGVHYPGADDGPRFNQAILALEAAASGLGVALARKSLVAGDLESGRLVRLWPEEAPTVFSYYIVCLPERVERGSTAIFIEWLRREAGS
ncbi:MAG TPA: transcriptional regulator GcvA [Alphaproteobacteria bacterium]